jgi:Holliday junction resolvasome RuvABC endonuclease subunit
MKSHHKATHHQKAMKHVADTATTGSALKGAMVDSHHKAMEPHHKAVEKHIADTVAIALTHHAVSEDG